MGSYPSRLLDELLADWSPFILLGILATAALARVFLHERAADERRRLRLAFGLFVVHVLLAPALAATDAGGRAHEQLHVASLAFEIGAAITAGLVLVFAVALPKLGVRVPRILRDVVTAVVFVVAFIGLLNRAGFPVSGLITTSAVLTAVLGFALQDTLGNVMGGLAIQMDNSVEVGDWITIGGVTGRVTEIRWRYTAIETRNWETVILPNSAIMKGQVMILGRRQGQPQQWRRSIELTVDYRTPPSRVLEVLHDALKGPIPHVAAEPRPNAVFFGFDQSLARYLVRYWLTQIATDDPVDSDVRVRLYYALRRAGIPFSMPAQQLFVTADTADRRKERDAAELIRRTTTLRRLELFEPLSDDDIGRLAAQVQLTPFAPGEQMTRQGDTASSLYVLLSGEAVVRVAVAGAEREVARLQPGSFFGEMSLMTGEPRSATVVAATTVECYRVDKDAFEEILRADAGVAEKIAGVLARRRLELQAVKEGLDQAAKERQLADTHRDLSRRIRSFFGL